MEGYFIGIPLQDENSYNMVLITLMGEEDTSG